jgi:S-DNA-T family DNA segregation ATPase FtsK/SpoIIIE
MDRRYRLFSSSGSRNIEAYNERMASANKEPLPYMAILIDELADLMMVAPDEIERSICRIAQLARATGIHLVIATQRPSVDVVTGLIKANFPARISFAVTTQVDSRVILDTPGAEKLLGRGDMLYMSSDSSKLLRLQGCFVSDEELRRIVQYWSEQVDQVGAEGEEAPLPWSDLEVEEEAEDDMLQPAIDLARGRDTISISFLQRRLRIGYPRAARLVDMMEDQGVVGPSENGGPREVLLTEEDLEDEDAPPF